jgi:hypothetical protein
LASRISEYCNSERQQADTWQLDAAVVSGSQHSASEFADVIWCDAWSIDPGSDDVQATLPLLSCPGCSIATAAAIPVIMSAKHMTSAVKRFAANLSAIFLMIIK